MRIGRTAHYGHLFIKEREKMFKPEPVLLCGGSGSGKSMVVAEICEDVEENLKKPVVTLFIFDAQDSYESAFAMFPATDKEQLDALREQGEEPEAKNVKIHYIYSKSGLKELLKRNKGKIPEGNIFTISLKNFGMQEAQFLLETEVNKKSVKLFLKSVKALNDTDGINEFMEYLREFSKVEKKKYLGQELHLDDESVADKSDYREIKGSLEIFEKDGFLMPDNFKLNLDIEKILSEPNTRHVFLYNTLSRKDKKLRHFVAFHILMEIDRHSSYAKNFNILVIEESQTLTPFKGKGYFVIMEREIGDMIGRIRKSGFYSLSVSRVWSGTGEAVRRECKKQLLGHLEPDDMLKFVKVGVLGKKEKDNIENLEIGEFVLKGKERQILKMDVPKHGHKHWYMNFIEEYRKHFPEKLTDYSDLIKEVEEQRAGWDKDYEIRKKKKLEEQKRKIKRAHQRKLSKDKTTEELKKIKVDIKKERELDKQKRDKEIVRVAKEMKLKGEKDSSRNIAKRVNKLGYKCSHEQVRLILEKEKQKKDTGNDIDNDIKDDIKKDEFKGAVKELNKDG